MRHLQVSHFLISVYVRSQSITALSKLYTTENAYRSHIQSRRHKENEIKSATRPPKNSTTTEESTMQTSQPEKANIPPVPKTEQVVAPSTSLSEDAAEAEVTQSIDEKIAAARARLSPSSCLFCNQQSSSLGDNLTHMSNNHSFFIPEADFLVDLPGLITYLGEKIAIGNVCIFCNEKGREFRTMDAVRKHMADKSHCKIAYDTENDRLELSDYYDFTSSYPDANTRTKKSKANSEDEGEWKETDDVEDGAVDEIVEESASDASEDDDEGSDEDDLPENQITYGDTNYELVLPSGARIGHRSMRRYYAQSFTCSQRRGKPEDPNSGAALVRRLLADKNSALVPRKGGFGSYGAGTEVVKARNKGEAKEAGRHIREFRDQKRKEDFRTKVAFIHNSQKHYRDPCTFILASFRPYSVALTTFRLPSAAMNVTTLHALSVKKYKFGNELDWCRKVEPKSKTITQNVWV